MTLKTSLFNRGIYKSTVKRYIWGAVFYFLVLFLMTALPILFSENPESVRYLPERVPRSIILDDVYIYFPIVLGLFVPTVTALLVYRFVHSKKSAIFSHSLPVSRRANYITTLLAALTLMCVPIILDGAILSVMSLVAYGELFDFASCLVWTGVNLLTILLMFSVASVSAHLTGNSFAMVGINVLIHLVAIIFAAGFSTLANTFLYGYHEVNTLINRAVEWNFVGYVMSLVNRLRYFPENVIFSAGKLGIMLAIAALLYAMAYLLYKKRRIETAEDVAAYKVLNPIFKYLLATLVAIGTFAIFSGMLEENAAFPVIITVVLAAVAYFASEMALKKSFKIWRTWRGYAVFALFFAAVVSTFAFTGFFGYEGRVPAADDVVSFAVYENQTSEIEDPFVEDMSLVGYVLEKHRAFAESGDIPIVRTYDEKRPRALFIKYKLRNGAEMTRRYYMSEREFCEILDRMYESREYKIKNLEAFSEVIAEIREMQLTNADVTLSGKDIASFMEALQQDLLALKFTESRMEGAAWETRLHIEYERADGEQYEYNPHMIHVLSQRVNANYKNTLSYLRKKGVWDKLFNANNTPLTVLTYEQWKAFADRERDLLELASGEKMTVDVAEARKIENIPGAVKITDAAAKEKIREFVFQTPVRYVPDKEFSYFVCTVNEGGYVTAIAAFYEDGAPLLEFVK